MSLLSRSERLVPRRLVMGQYAYPRGNHPPPAQDGCSGPAPVNMIGKCSRLAPAATAPGQAAAAPAAAAPATTNPHGGATAATACPAGPAGCAAAAARRAATAASRHLYGGLECLDAFLVEDIEGRQVDVGELLLAKSK